MPAPVLASFRAGQHLPVTWLVLAVLIQNSSKWSKRNNSMNNNSSRQVPQKVLFSVPLSQLNLSIYIGFIVYY